MSAETAPRLRIVFFGSGAFGLPLLERLAAQHDVALVVTQPDRPAGRGRALHPTPVAAWAGTRGLDMLRVEDVNDEAARRRVHAVDAAALVIVAFGQKLSPALLGDTPAFNLHASLLPLYRGAAPINRAMMDGRTTTGVSVITIAQRMDAGAVLARAETPIDPAETAGELHDRLAVLGVAPVLDVLDRVADGSYPGAATEQDEAAVVPAPKLAKAEGTVDFAADADRVRARIHGLTPWPGCTVLLRGRALRLGRVTVEPGDAGGPPGTLSPDGRVACGSGAVRVVEIQPPGSRMMTFGDYARGHPVEAGDRLVPRRPAPTPDDR
ncbi:MAG: methionyl-tRNA formyltransferase [Planctomycetota bacterium]|jgi:methionyl-tRNA formyltransferase